MIFIQILLTFVFPFLILAIDDNDTRELTELNLKLIKGVYFAELRDVYDSLMAGADPNSILTEDVGLKLELGVPWKNYPLAPVIHIAMGGGTEAHYHIATLLLDAGANPNVFSSKYPPAVLYSLGYWKPPFEGLAATIQGLFRTEKHYAKFFLEASIKDFNKFRNYTHNPPLLSYAVYRKNSDGIIALLSDGKVSPNSADKYGVTALHLAVWLGHWEIAAHLILNGADPSLTDNRGRTPLHYACIRGIYASIQMFFHETVGLSHKKLKKVLARRDIYGYTAMDILLRNSEHQSELVTKVMELLTNANLFEIDEEENENINFKYFKYTRKPSYTAFNGWDCPSEATVLDSTVENIDVMHVSDLTESVFMQQYMAQQRPLLITGNLTGFDSSGDGSGVWGIWRHLEKSVFASRYQNLRVDTVQKNTPIYSQ